MAKSKISKAPAPPINSVVAEYVSLREQAKAIKSRMDYLSKEIKTYASANGAKDDKGSYYCQNESFIFGSQAKKSITFAKERALDFFKTHGLLGAIKMVETIDEQAVEAYIADGQISVEELESITNTSVSYAVDVKERTAAESTVEESTVRLAASTKSHKSVRAPK